MAGHCRIRPANSADAEGLAALERAIFSDAWPASAFEARGPGERAFVADDETGVLAGFIVGRAVLDEGEILDLAVRSDARRRGVGTQLLDALLGALQGAGVARVHLEVRASNVGAQSFYRRHGFLVSGRRRAYYRTPPEDAVLMGRDVTPVTSSA